MTRVGIIALSLALTAGSAQAHFLNGNKLYELCTAPEYLKQMECLGYVQATADYLNSMRFLNHLPECPPGEATGRQVVDVVVNYLRDRPQDRTLDADTLAVFAFASAWRCSP
jgi:hypothetical protein